MSARTLAVEEQNAVAKMINSVLKQEQTVMDKESDERIEALKAAHVSFAQNMTQHEERLRNMGFPDTSHKQKSLQGLLNDRNAVQFSGFDVPVQTGIPVPENTDLMRGSVIKYFAEAIDLLAKATAEKAAKP